MSKRAKKLWLGTSFKTALVLLSTPVLAKEVARGVSPDGAYGITLATLPKGDKDPGLPVNQMTSLIVKITTKDGKPVPMTTLPSFDARMPEHGHGMVVKPKAAPGATSDEVRIDGVKLHMAGNWEFQIQASIPEPSKPNEPTAKPSEKVVKFVLPFKL